MISRGLGDPATSCRSGAAVTASVHSARTRSALSWLAPHTPLIRACLQADLWVVGDLDSVLTLTPTYHPHTHPGRPVYCGRPRPVHLWLVTPYTSTADGPTIHTPLPPPLHQADLFVVGDPDQSIYGWRGADMANMTHAFTVDFPDAQVGVRRDNAAYVVVVGGVGGGWGADLPTWLT